jgi:hypothetical protein
MHRVILCLLQYTSAVPMHNVLAHLMSLIGKDQDK